MSCTGWGRDLPVLEAAFQVLSSATDCSDELPLKPSGGQTFSLVGHSGFAQGPQQEPMDGVF